MAQVYDTAANIRGELARQRVSARELARRLDVPPMWVHRRLTGQAPLTVDDLLRIAAELDVPAASLLGEQVAA